MGHGEAYNALPFIFGWPYSIAASIALLKDINRLVVGVNQLDVRLDPQFRPEALQAFENAVNVATERDDFVIDTPFIHQSKQSVLNVAEAIGVPLGETRSCLKESDTHCGECRGCLRRQQAFFLSDVEDPTDYIDPVDDLAEIELPHADSDYSAEQQQPHKERTE